MKVGGNLWKSVGSGNPRATEVEYLEDRGAASLCVAGDTGVQWIRIGPETFPDKEAAKAFIKKLPEGRFKVKHACNNPGKGTSYSLYTCASRHACPAQVRLKQESTTRLFWVERSSHPHANYAGVEAWTGRGVPRQLLDSALTGIRAGVCGKVGM